jgi:hypothetical protein
VPPTSPALDANQTAAIVRDDDGQGEQDGREPAAALLGLSIPAQIHRCCVRHGVALLTHRQGGGLARWSGLETDRTS